MKTERCPLGVLTTIFDKKWHKKCALAFVSFTFARFPYRCCKAVRIRMVKKGGDDDTIIASTVAERSNRCNFED